MTATIRAATQEDVEAIADLWIDMMREHQGFEPRLALSADARDHYAKYAEYHIQNRESYVFVAEEEPAAGAATGRIVGFALGYRVRNYPMFQPAYYGFISDVTVAPDRRGGGLGERLTRRLEGEFTRAGVHHSQLHVYCGNAGGKRFWSRLGYSPFIEGRIKPL